MSITISLIMGKRCRRFPSQVRYDQRNPCVAVRLSADERDALREHAERAGTSISNVIRDALFPHLKDELSAWRAGYRAAMTDYRTWFYCKHCGEEITILPGQNTHTAIIVFMDDAGWHHSSCTVQQQ